MAIRRHIILDVAEKGLDPRKPHSSLHKNMLKGKDEVVAEAAPAVKKEVKPSRPDKPKATPASASSKKSDETKTKPKKGVAASLVEKVTESKKKKED